MEKLYWNIFRLKMTFDIYHKYQKSYNLSDKITDSIQHTQLFQYYNLDTTSFFERIIHTEKYRLSKNTISEIRLLSHFIIYCVDIRNITSEYFINPNQDIVDNIIM